MNVPVTYPGVYINEGPTSVRSIPGVDTAITAFIGSALRGVENEAVLVQDFGAYQRIFGGLSRHHPMSFAVSQFFDNGGKKALIVRVVRQGVATASTVTAGTLNLVAANPGSWGNELSVTISHPDVLIHPTAGEEGLFNLEIVDNGTGFIETFENISSLQGHANHATGVLEHSSNLVRIDGALNEAPRPVEVSGVGFDPTGVDGGPITDTDVSTGSNMQASHEGLWALDKVDIFNLLCIPPYELNSGDIGVSTRTAAAAYCLNRRAIFIADPLRAWSETGDITDGASGLDGSDWGLNRNPNTAVYFPRIIQPDPFQSGQTVELAPCGAIAGVIARTDSNRGVWKAPAGPEANLAGASALSAELTDGDIDVLNPLSVNCLRNLAGAGRVVWGARTLAGSNQLASEWKYLPVRRTALFIEESLHRGTRWAAFEPNNEPLWANIRLNVGAFLHDLFRKGAFQGTSPAHAYLVKCDSETTTPTDIDKGIVNILVGFAPLKPAEFVIIKIEQLAGDNGT